MKTWGFIFARGGSKGVPHKNIRSFCGRPLISWAIEAGLKSGLLERIIVSTDSPEIAQVAREWGAETPFMRPAELASDTAAEGDAWRHAISRLRAHGEDFDIFVSLPATAPLRTPEDIRKCVELYKKGDCDAVITAAEAHRSPYFNMIVLDENGFAKIAMPPDQAVVRRQDAPPVYDMSTVAYVTSPQFIMSGKPILEGKSRVVFMDKINALDIDDLIDLEIAEYFMAKRMSEK